MRILTRCAAISMLVGSCLWAGEVNAQSLPTPDVPTSIDLATGANVGCEMMFGTQACGGSGGGGRPIPLDTIMYLAIAMSPNYTTAASWAPNEAVAGKVAMAECVKRGGTACRVVSSDANVCASVAVDKVQKIVAVEKLKGSSWNASGVALSKCRNRGGRSCVVTATACAHGYVSATPWSPPGRGDGSYQPPVLRK
jgi:Domain of unknown function (DUF4189)